MKTYFEIRNFRKFDKEGVIIPILPITILTGCNSSGKSSIVKSLCLLRDFWREMEIDHEDGKDLRLNNYRIDFHKRPHDILGSFKHVVHRDEEKNDKNHIEFEFLVNSHILMQDVILEVAFCSHENDDLDNGYLHSYKIRTLDDHTLFSSEDGKGCEWDFMPVKQDILYFLYGQNIASTYQDEANVCQATGDNVDEKIISLLNDMLKNVYSDKGGQALVELLEWQVTYGLHKGKSSHDAPKDALIRVMELDETLLEAPRLNVFHFFPFMCKMKDLKKEDCRAFVMSRLHESKQLVSELNLALIDLLFDEFERSSFSSIHEFVSNFADATFFKNNQGILLNSGLTCKLHTSWLQDTQGDILSIEDIPDELNVTSCILALDTINKIVTGTEKSYVEYDNINYREHYYNSYRLDSIFETILVDILLNAIPADILYTSTGVVSQKRLYALDDSTEFVDTLKLYFEIKRRYLQAPSSPFDKKGKDYKPCDFLNKWISQLGIAHHVEIIALEEGFGAVIRLFSNENDKEGVLLSDKGYGVAQLFAILLKIEIAILQSQYNILRNGVNKIGINPELFDCLRNWNQLAPITVALEEPENHLHPSFQSKLADMVVEAMKQYNVHFIIESHSEYLIRKMQLLVKQEAIGADDVSLLYLNPDDRKSFEPRIVDIGISKDGCLKNDFGSGFFDESTKLAKELISKETNTDEKKL